MTNLVESSFSVIEQLKEKTYALWSKMRRRLCRNKINSLH